MTSLRALLASAGFHGHGLDIAVAVARAESGAHPTAHNTNASTGDNSYGLFQINMIGNLGPERLHQYGLTSNDQLFDPATNARVAYQLSNHGTSWTPWTTYTRGLYKKYLGEDVQIGGGSTTWTDPNAGAPTGPGDTTQSPDFNIENGQSLADLHASQQHLLQQLDYAAGLGPPPADLPATGHANPPTGHANPDALHTFIDAAVAQRGDAYVFGAKGAGQADPTAFDCSGLTKWAAHQAGVELPDGAGYQYLSLKKQGMLIPVDQAIHTPGALLFHFASEPQPGTGEPAIAHVAISLGNGMTIEAADPQDGVTEFHAAGRFNYAAIIPGIGTTDPSSHPSFGVAQESFNSAGLQPGNEDLFATHTMATDHAGGFGSGIGAHSATGGVDDGHDFDHGGWDAGH